MKVTIEHKEEAPPILTKWIVLNIDGQKFDCTDDFEVLDNVALYLGMKIEKITVNKLT